MFWKKKNEDKSKEHKPRYVKICPRCQSINIKISHQGGSSGLTALGVPTVYVCMDCNYKNYAFPEIDINELKNKKYNGKKENNNNQ